MRRVSKIFPVILPLLILVAVGVLGLSLQKSRRVTTVSGCGCDFSRATGDFMANEKTAIFLDQPVSPPLVIQAEPARPLILGEVSPAEKWVEIDLSEQKLIAWEGGRKFLESLVSSGKWAPTPTGQFNIWGKFKYAKMSGGNKENHTYYYLPNVPYTMYFFKGFGLHGTYWHNNFGQPMSHGCVNLPTLIAERLFYWTTPTLPANKNSVAAAADNPGTRVVIHE